MVKEAPEPSRLEQLPPELRLSILATLNLDQVKNLIKSCPTFHQQYRHDRRFILGSVLHTTLGSLAVDAYAVHLTSPAKFDNAHPEDAIPRFLNGYQRLRSSPGFSLLEQGLTENDMSDLVMFYLSVIRPFTEKCRDWAFTNLEKAFNQPRTPGPLSPTEELRIMRALYRFQLWCNLFGSQKQCFEEVDILDMFFGLYEPWEVEEINSVHTFATDGFYTYLGWYRDIRNARIVAADGFYVQFDSNYPGAQSESDGKTYEKVKCTFHGTEILPSTSTQLTALYTSLFNTIHECEYNFNNHLFYRVLGKDTQVDRRIDHPSARDQRERDQEPFPFKGDDPAQPPVAWTQTWGDEYSNLFGDFIPDCTPEWGLMMWDETRFRELEGYEVVWYTCKDWWMSGDPRERFRDQEEDD